MNKERIKECFPILYGVWHKARIRHNEKADVKRKKAYDKYGYEVLRKLYSMVIQKGYEVSCYHGTLLGLVRDKKLIPWDDDLDFVILNRNNFSWEKFELDMHTIGFIKYRDIENEKELEAQAYKYKGVLCDFTLKKPGTGFHECKYGCYQIPENKYSNGEFGLYNYWIYDVPMINKLDNINVCGIDLLIPENSIDILIAYYGENWMIPDPDFKPTRKSIQLPAKITYY